MDIIKCAQCNKPKKISEFSIFHGRRNITCNDCRKYYNKFYKDNRNSYKDRRKEYYLANKEEHAKRMYKNHIRRKYNLTLENLDRMIEKQDNKCLICNKNFSILEGWNKRCVDHDHKTGKIRGILCRKCNISLHYIEDNNLWKQAQNYLRLKDISDKEPIS